MSATGCGSGWGGARFWRRGYPSGAGAERRYRKLHPLTLTPRVGAAPELSMHNRGPLNPNGHDLEWFY
jgi:hypothetical protein